MEPGAQLFGAVTWLLLLLLLSGWRLAFAASVCKYPRLSPLRLPARSVMGWEARLLAGTEEGGERSGGWGPG